MPQNNIDMEQVAQATHQGSPHKSGQIAGMFEKDGELTMERKKRKREPRPESIIIYRTGNEKVEEDQQDLDSTGRNTEERTNFLCPPSAEGRSYHRVAPHSELQPSVITLRTFSVHLKLSPSYNCVPFLRPVHNVTRLSGRNEQKQCVGGSVRKPCLVSEQV